MHNAGTNASDRKADRLATCCHINPLRPGRKQLLIGINEFAVGCTGCSTNKNRAEQNQGSCISLHDFGLVSLSFSMR
jgi:hypothetical protein